MKSSGIGQKIRLIRKSEMMTRQQFAEACGIPLGTLDHYEGGRTIPSMEVAQRILAFPKLTKYTLWLMTDQVAPEAGQIAPALAHFGQEATGYSASDQKTG
ncbi:helix-turn-helix transcriptional regulator [Aeromonas sp. 1HA1]|uniref:helix-turn-helix transcriptional regulator n=1 Tax=Aeromonas sp. 1HA1 TaxID=2699193 RepID=UPI0023DD8C29|nr:helix-turn-helix transcriptional regulator [Aeromonas sp. 1HA1]MDF2414167.1 helix-turn-helix domain-containing protein [Aeromonas sp. 1HA1]